MDSRDLSLSGSTPVFGEGPPAPPGSPLDGSPFAERSRASIAARNLRKRVGGGLAAAGALVVKFFSVIKGALLVLPKLKLLTTSGTALVSVAAYSLFWGWTFAAGFVVLLFLHEIGHVIQLRREGIKASAPMFIPFLGAVITAKSLGQNALAEARVGLAGPILGSLAAAAVWVVAELTGSSLLLALAYAGFFLNLFNLIPLSPFDGGRVTAAISPRLWLLGVPLLVGLFFYSPSPLLILMAVLALPNVLKAWRGLGSPEQPYYAVSAETRVSYSALYLGLAAFLAIMCEQLHAELPHTR
jgi:Zn-dependent protease